MTSKRILYISLTFLTILSCLPYAKVENYDKLINVNEIKEQKYLDRTIPTDYIIFFNKMINQRLSKLIGNNWEIFLKDSLNVYYGYSILTKNGIYTDTIFSICKSELEKHFPLYDKMEFCAIKSKLLDYAYNDFDFGYNYKITFAKDSIFMTSNGIVINTHRKYKSYSQNQLSLNKGDVQFEILVDKITLELINKSVIK